MANAKQFLKKKLLEKGGLDESKVAEVFGSSEGKDLCETLFKEGLASEEDLLSYLQEYAQEQEAAGNLMAAQSIVFGETVVESGQATILEVWDGLNEQEVEREAGSEKTLDHFIEKEIDTSLTLNLLQEKGKKLVMCRDCGRREIIDLEKSDETHNCPECGGAFVPAEDMDKIPAPMIKPDVEEEDPLKGTIVGGCTLEKKLGAGGMGYVYKAQHLALNKPVAIKFLSEHITNEASKKRFLKEARAAARLEHSNIVSVYDTGVDRGRHYIVMQFIEGESVSEMIKGGGPLPVLKALDIAIEAAKGTAAAHNLNLIHRDIKPDNIMVDKNGEVKVADFGLAKDLSDESGITLSQQAMGTPNYMSPEQANDARSVDKRADIYSFGVTLYAMLAGQPPYTGSTPWAIISQHQNEPVPDIREKNPNVPEELWLVIQKMMAKLPEQRFQDLSEVIDAFVLIRKKLDMEGFEDDEETLKKLSAMTRDLHVATPLTFQPDAQRRQQRNMLLMGGSAVLAVVVLVLGGLYLGGVFDPPPEPQPTPGTTPGTHGGTPSAKGSDTEKPPDLTPEEAAKKALDELLDEVQSLTAKKEYVEALTALAGFPARFRETPSWKACEAEKPGILKAAMPGIRRGLDDIDDRLKSGEVRQAEERLVDLEKNVEALSSAWPDAGASEGWGDLVRDTQEKKSKVRTLRAELNWISTVQRDPKVLGDEELDEALKRLQRDAKGGVRGAEREASGALLVLKGEWNRRSGERYRREFEKVSDDAMKKASDGLFDEAFKAIGPYLDSKDREIRRTAQKLQRDFQSLAQRIEGDMNRLKEVESLIETPKWTDLDVAEARFESLLRGNIHKIAKAKARKQIERIVQERERRKASFETESFHFRSKGTYRLGSDDPRDQNKKYTGQLAAFLIADREVTNAEFERFVTDSGHSPPPHWKGKTAPPELADHPVTFVSVADARAYCLWLSETTGKKFRLPTKGEWQISAGWDAESKGMRSYPWGEEFEEGKANLGAGAASPVGSHEADRSPCGALDMAGNVCEWATDSDGLRSYSCGGCFDDENDPAAARCAFCHALPPATRGRSLGFRVLRVLD